MRLKLHTPVLTNLSIQDYTSYLAKFSFWIWDLNTIVYCIHCRSLSCLPFSAHYQRNGTSVVLNPFGFVLHIINTLPVFNFTSAGSLWPPPSISEEITQLAQRRSKEVMMLVTNYHGNQKYLYLQPSCTHLCIITSVTICHKYTGRFGSINCWDIEWAYSPLDKLCNDIWKRSVLKIT